jgi:CRISPR-associated protein Cmr1
VSETDVIVPLQTVTPLFLAGSEPRGAPELRPPSFRGALRYWLRAALGGVLGDDLAAVRAAESAVFGSTDGRAGGASAVVVRVRHGELPDAKPYPRLSRPPTPENYLYWSMAESGRADRGTLLDAKRFYPASVRLDLMLACRPGTSGGGGAVERAAAALWLLVQLGGIGSRSRRTAGSLSVRRVFEVAGLQFMLDGGEPAVMAARLADGLTIVRALMTRNGRGLRGLPRFDVLHPDACSVWVLGMWRSVDAAIDAIGRGLRDGRAAVPLAQRAVFGLPLQGVTATAGRAPARRVERRASPLWLSVSRTASGNIVGVATLFRSRFLDEGGSLATAQQDYAVIERAVRSQFPSAVEVAYA